MEQKVKDKMDVATKAIQTMEQDINVRWNNFCTEFYTNDVEHMVANITDYTHCVYKYKLYDDRYLLIRDGRLLITNQHTDCICSIYIEYILTDCKNYDDYEVRLIEEHAKKIRGANRFLNLLYDNAKLIIQDIVEKYTEITEQRSTKMDEVLNMLNVSYEPTKHIKVTVEWI